MKRGHFIVIIIALFLFLSLVSIFYQNSYTLKEFFTDSNNIEFSPFSENLLGKSEVLKTGNIEIISDGGGYYLHEDGKIVKLEVKEEHLNKLGEALSNSEVRVKGIQKTDSFVVEDLELISSQTLERPKY